MRKKKRGNRKPKERKRKVIMCLHSPKRLYQGVMIIKGLLTWMRMEEKAREMRRKHVTESQRERDRETERQREREGDH